MNALPEAGEFRPESLSRRGELFAWALTLVVMIAWAIEASSKQVVIRAVPFLGFFLLTIALSISLGNWMDRRTRLVIDEQGVLFENGLRRARLKWQEITQVQIFPSPWGKKVRIIGTHSHFDFRTLGEVKVQGGTKGKMGFAAGDQIVDRILAATKMKEIKHTEAGYYYARE